MRLKHLARAACAAALLAASFMPAATMAQTKTLRFVAHADLTILDPTFTTAYISRNFGYMVYDTLFAQDASGHPQPQMVDKWTTSKDGLAWTFTLRPGLKFSDGKDVTAADAVASIVRWESRDSFGGALKKAGAEWTAVDAKTFKLQLKEPFGMVLDALDKPSGFPAIVLPERLAKLPTTAPISEVVGSGPYLFKRDEWLPGSKVVFVRNPAYVARTEAPSGLAGSKKSHFDRIEWLYLPDSNSAVSALKKGEVDFIEQVPADYITPLRADANVKLLSAGTQQAQLIMNPLHPPFNNPKVRQALLKAVSQERFNAAMGYPLDMRMRYCATYFICGSANDTAAGADAYRTPDVAKARQMLQEAG
jgi:peptide/nickel transport system substrate-binding protein